VVGLDRLHGAEAPLDPREPRNYESYSFLCPNRLIREGLIYGCDIQKGEITEDVIYSRLHDYDSRVIVNGVAVKKPRSLSPFDLKKLAHVLYVICFERRLEDAMVSEFLRMNLKQLDELVSSSFLSVAVRGVFWGTLSEGASYIDRIVTKGARQYLLENSEQYPLFPNIAPCERYVMYGDVLEVTLSTLQSSQVGFLRSCGKEEVLRNLVDPKSFYSVLLAKKEMLIEAGHLSEEFLDDFSGYLSKLPVSPGLSSTYTDDTMVADVINLWGKLEYLDGPVLGAMVAPSYASGAFVTVPDPSERASDLCCERERSKNFKMTTGLQEDLYERIMRDTDGALVDDLRDVRVDFVDGARYFPLLTPTQKIRGVLPVLQDGYDKIFPGTALDVRYYDSENVALSDLEMNFSVSKMRITTSKIMPPKDATFFEPKVRTMVSRNRPREVKEEIIALAKRNMDTPQISQSTQFITTANRVFKKFFEKFCVPNYRDLLRDFQANPVRINSTNAAEYVTSLTPDKLKKFGSSSFMYSDVDVSRYQAFIRPAVKPKCERAAEHEYAALQTVIYHDKSVNGAYGGIFREIFRRLEMILGPKVAIFAKKDPEELKQFLNKNCSYNTRRYFVENDFSKYDKSQQEFCLMLEWAFYELLGFGLEELEMWRRGNMDSSVIDMSLGLAFYLMWQRRSGAQPTLLGNILVNMFSVADTYDIEPELMEAAAFVGDDSIITMYRPTEILLASHQMADVFNLSAGAYEGPVGYFASMYFVQTENGVDMLYDPIKALEKLGVMDTADEEKLREKFVSLSEKLRGYDNEVNLEALDSAVCQRKQLSSSIMPFLRALYTISVDYSEFRSLYSDKPITVRG